MTKLVLIHEMTKKLAVFHGPILFQNARTPFALFIRSQSNVYFCKKWAEFEFHFKKIAIFVG